MVDSKYIDELKNELKESGFKLTYQRRNIVEVMLEQEGEHLTSEEIYDIVKKRCPEIGLATIYRTLQILDKVGHINKLNLNDGCVRYELKVDTNSHNHHHLICDKCGQIIEVEDDMLDSIEKEISKKYNFKVLNHDLKFHGICENCI